jgi:glucarate dehydratase
VTALRITRVVITPVAFRDPPLLNAVGVHEQFALRAIVQLHTDAGIVGLGETYGDADHLELLQRLVPQVIGFDVFAVNELRQQVATSLGGATRNDRHGLTGQATRTGTVDRVFAAFEVACLDAQGRAIGRPVSDLLGGAVRAAVPYSAYLFYKWAAHPGESDDRFGAALDTDGIVAQAQQIVAEYGFGAIKLKGGVLPPCDEVDAILALRAAFPDAPLRLDPNAAWSVPTAIEVGRRLDGVLEYLEDPVPGLAGMAEVARAVPMPLATNMCVVSFDQVPEAVRVDAVGIVLSDHHFWGGLTRSKLLAGLCDTFGLGLSMHSNSHLGISLAAMTHLGAATPGLTYACDTHWPWKDPDEDVVVAGTLRFVDGAVPVPSTPGLGVELDVDALERMHDQYLRCDVRTRDDTGYRRRFEPDYRPASGL